MADISAGSSLARIVLQGLVLQKLTEVTKSRYFDLGGGFARREDSSGLPEADKADYFRYAMRNTPLVRSAGMCHHHRQTHNMSTSRSSHPQNRLVNSRNDGQDAASTA